MAQDNRPDVTTLRGRLAMLRDRHETRRLLEMTRAPFRRWLLSPDGRQSVIDLMGAADQARTLHLGRDFREWTREQRSSPFGVGSGRRAFWHAGTFQHYALICRLLHERLGRMGDGCADRKRRWYGWTGERVRQVARLLVRTVPCTTEIEPLPTREILALALFPAGYYDRGTLRLELDGKAMPHETMWQLWMSRIAGPAWGRYVLDAYVERMRREPQRRTPVLIVGEIRRLRGDLGDADDFRNCSGCEYLGALAERPELHDWLLARAGEAVRTKVGDIDAVYVPFGLPYPAEFDYCFQLGLDYEIRVRRADWDAMRPELRADVVVGRAGSGISVTRQIGATQ